MNANFEQLRHITSEYLLTYTQTITIMPQLTSNCSQHLAACAERRNTEILEVLVCQRQECWQVNLTQHRIQPHWTYWRAHNMGSEEGMCKEVAHAHSHGDIVSTAEDVKVRIHQRSAPSPLLGSNENARPENEGPNRSKTDWHDWKMRDQISRVGKWRTRKCGTRKCRTENAVLENAGPKMQGWKMWDQFHFINWIERNAKMCCDHCITFISSYAAVYSFCHCCSYFCIQLVHPSSIR